MGAQGIQGIQGIQGVAGATGAQGATGATGAIGAQGIQGVAGLPGTNGNSIRNGSGIPASNLGIDGDFYLDTTSFKVYGPKALGSWSGTPQSLIGPQGPIGPQGLQGLTGATGAVGSTGVAGASGLAGPIGPAGPQGPQGQAGASPGMIGSVPFIDGADATSYSPLSGTSRVVTTQTDAAIELPTSGVLSNLSVRVSSPGAVTLTVVVDGVSSALACTAAANAKSCVDSTHSVTIPAGKTVSLRVDNGGASVANLRYSMKFAG